MCQFVSVIKDLLETHSQAATDQQQPHQDQKSLTPADQVHVALMLSAEREMELLLAPVFLVSLEIHMFNVSQSAQSIQNVPATRPVSIRNVLTLVQEFVEPMLLVQSRITILHAPVTQDIQEIHSDTAQELQLYLFLQKSSILASLHLVDPMLCVMRGTERLPASVYQNTSETPT